MFSDNLKRPDDDSKVLRDGVGIDPLAVFSACSMVAVRLALDVFDVALELGTIALRLESRITDQLPVLDHDLVEILWLILSSAERPEEVEHWLTVAGKLNASQIARLISCEMAASTARFVCDRLWMKEEDRPKEEQRWAALDRKIEFLENLANSARVDIIFVTLRRARIVITSTHQMCIRDSCTCTFVIFHFWKLYL